MKKNKLALLSMIVVSTVFCLTMILNIPFPIYSSKRTITTTENAVSTASKALSAEDQKIVIQSFSLEQTDDYSEDQSVGKSVVNQADISTNNSLTEETDATGEASDQTESMTSATPDTLNGAATEAPSAGEEETTGEANVTSSKTDETAAAEEAKVSANEAVEEEQPEALYANIGISIAKEYVNIRKEPSTEGEVLGKLYRNSACTILDTKGDWYYIESGTVTGYVKAELIKTGLSDNELIEKYGTKKISVTADGLNVRKEKSTDSKKLTVIYMNEKYPVEEVDGDWILIHIEDENITGYVTAKYAELIADFKDAVSKEEEQKLLQLQAEERARKETVVVYNNGYNYTAEDLKLLACLVHAESGTQSYEGKLAVANIVLNRVKSSKYPDTIKAVIYQSGQFTVAASGSLDKQLNNYDNYSSKSQLMSIKAAKDALEGANNIGKRLYFHTIKAATKEGYTSYSSSVKIGAHLFW